MPLYSCLDASKKHIRLLRISPARQDDRSIECELTTVSLQEWPLYNALSYCWGSPDTTSLVQINGCIRIVTKNLAAALRHLRNTGDAEMTPLWIDAVCINQQDIAERSAQVAMMREIYAGALCVHIWLGDREYVHRDDVLALGDVGRPRDKLRAGERHGPSRIGASSPVPWIGKVDHKTLQKLDQLASLGRNPYWKRTWILQEVSFAEHVVVHGDGERVALDNPGGVALLTADDHLVWLHADLDYDSGRDQGYKAASVAQHISRYDVIKRVELARSIFAPIRSAVWNSKVARAIEAGETFLSGSVPQMLSEFRESLATDPRDKIYGILGLLRTVLDLYPDYSKSAEEVYSDATMLVFARTGDMELLTQACSGNPSLPSWVPDYSKPSRVVKFSIKANYRGVSYGATPRSVRSESGVLRTRCYVFDKVSWVERCAEAEAAQQADILESWTRWSSLYVAHCTEAPVDPSLGFARLYVFSGKVYYDHERTEQYPKWLQQLSVALPIGRTIGRKDPDFADHLTEMLSDYDFFITEHGRPRLAPKGAIGVQDRLVIIAGAHTPFCAQDIAVRGEPRKMILKAPCIIHADFPDNPPSEDVNFGKTLLGGGAVVAEAIRRFDNPTRIDDVFEEVLLA